MHLAIVGAGRLGSVIAYTLVHEWYIDEISLVDIKPGLAKTLEEELRHVAASLGRDITFYSHERSSEVSGADIVIIVAGKPRTADMTRRDLAGVNGGIVASIAREIYPHNREARYVIVTNPVDAMATLFKQVTGARYVISTGTHLDSVRFRSEIAKILKVPVSSVEAYVGGEHGPRSVFLWSLTSINGIKFEEYIKKEGIKVSKDAIENSVREVARKIIANLGATLYGPASAFRDIIRAVALNTGHVLSIASPAKFSNIPIEVNVGIPQKVGWKLGYTFYDKLTAGEKKLIEKAARSIYEAYLVALKSMGYS